MRRTRIISTAHLYSYLCIDHIRKLLRSVSVRFHEPLVVDGSGLLCYNTAVRIKICRADKFQFFSEGMEQMEREGKKHLPVLGIGPALCFPTVAITAVAIVLSIKEIIPKTEFNIIVNTILIVLGVLLIIEALILFFGADIGGNLIDNIKDNKLKTNGTYKYVRNPCYTAFMLGCTGTILIAHNLYLLIIPILFWIEMTIVLKNTEEKWLTNLYGQEYIDYCKRVNRCIPWFPRKK